MNSVMQYAQDVVDMNRRSQYVDTDCTILKRCVASVAGAWFIPTACNCPAFGRNVVMWNAECMGYLAEYRRGMGLGLGLELAFDSGEF